MKRQFLVIFLYCLVSGLSYSQIVFEKGYLINDSNRRIECLIKNKEWKNNPTVIEIKLSQDVTVRKISVENAKEFGIGDEVKFISALVMIDRSGEDVDGMSSESRPIFQQEHLFLKTIVEGKASLYSYMDGNLVRFFYKMDDSEIKQLVFKSYRIDDKISRNFTFRQQLINDLNCQSIDQKDFELLNYNTKELKKIFLKFNNSTDSAYTLYDVRKKRDWFELSITSGLNCSNFDLRSESSYFKFERDFTFRFGMKPNLFCPLTKASGAYCLNQHINIITRKSSPIDQMR